MTATIAHALIPLRRAPFALALLATIALGTGAMQAPRPVPRPALVMRDATLHDLTGEVWAGFEAPGAHNAVASGGYVDVDGNASDGGDAVAYGFLDVTPVSPGRSRVAVQLHLVRGTDESVLKRFVDVDVDGDAADLSAVWRRADQGADGIVVVVDARAGTAVAFSDQAPARVLWQTHFALPQPAQACLPRVDASVVRISCRFSDTNSAMSFYGVLLDTTTGLGQRGPLLSHAAHAALAQPGGRRAGNATAAPDGRVRAEAHGLVVTSFRNDVMVLRGEQEVLRIGHGPTKRDVRFAADVIAPDLVLVWHQRRGGTLADGDLHRHFDSASEFAIYDLRTQAMVFAQGWDTDLSFGVTARFGPAPRR